MDRIKAGRAYCALCGQTIRPSEDALTTPDFLADDSDPFWSFTDAAMHRACFLVWDRRKAFVARFNRAARSWVESDGSHPRMTSEGEIVRIPVDPVRQVTPLSNKRMQPTARPFKGSVG
jgi:hypothetical protein